MSPERIECGYCRDTGVLIGPSGNPAICGACRLGHRLQTLRAKSRKRREPNTLARRVQDLRAQVEALERARERDVADMEQRYEDAHSAMNRTVIELRGQIEDLKRFILERT
jgi:hypothetical protein